MFPSENLRALTFYARDVIRKLPTLTGQLVMDATYGTNSGGMDLLLCAS